MKNHVRTRGGSEITFVHGEHLGALMSVIVVPPGDFVGPWLA
jgi:hypothetical protein